MRTKKPHKPFTAVALATVLLLAFSCDLQNDLYAILLAEIGYTVTVEAGGPGEVEPKDTFVTNENPLRIKAIPADGYELSMWTSSGTGSGDVIAEPSSEETTIRLAGNGSIVTANFVPWTLTVDAGTGGTIIAGGGYYTLGNPMTIVADVYSGYTFSNWTKVSGKGTPVFANASLASTSVTLTGGSCTIRANFTPITFTIAVTQPTHGMISLSPSGGTYATGTSVTVTLTPDPGYAFVAWIVSGPISISTNPGTFLVAGNGAIACSVQYQCPIPAGFRVTTSTTTGSAGASTLSLAWDTLTDPNVPSPMILFERSPDGASWTSVSPTGTSSTTAVDSGLDAATRYHYRIILRGAGCIDSPPSPARVGMTLDWNGTASMPVLGTPNIACPACPELTTTSLPYSACELPGTALMAGGYTYFAWGSEGTNSAQDLIIVCAFDSTGAYTGLNWRGANRYIVALSFNNITGTLFLTTMYDGDTTMLWSALRTGTGM